MLMDVIKPADLQATRVLSLDAAGRILDWISWQDAVCLYVRDVVAWTLGDPCLTVHGGHNRELQTGLRGEPHGDHRVMRMSEVRADSMPQPMNLRRIEQHEVMRDV